MGLIKRILELRNSPILLRIPPYLSAICTLVGIAWLLLLPLDDLSRNTYISENAILPGQVHTYFGGSEHNVFRAYRQEVFALAGRSDAERVAGIESILRDSGLKAVSQHYSFTVSGENVAQGENVYGILQGPRADATEAMALVAAWKNFDGEINYSGVALALTLARYFARWSIWSKDIVVLIPNDSVYGPEAWVSAYHGTEEAPTSTRNISALPLKAGALQGAVALDYPVGPWGKRFDKLDILYDGINGALPNLDLLNTAISIATGNQGIKCSFHNLLHHTDSYSDRFTTMAKGIMTQTAGHATGPHSAFMPYHIDAITLKTVGDGWHDEMSLGRTTESLMRSINNLLEHLHQSFFFYILLNTHRFVSIGNYLPAAMLMAGSFTITALARWVTSGRVEPKVKSSAQPHSKGGKQPGKDTVSSAQVAEQSERHIALPAAITMSIHLAGFIPVYLLNTLSLSYLSTVFNLVAALTLILPFRLGAGLTAASRQQIEILQAFSLLFLGASLSTLATLNFSLAFVIGLLCCPLSFVQPLPSLPPRSAVVTRDDGQQYARKLAVYLPVTALYLAISPPIVLYALNWQLNGLQGSVRMLLFEMAKGWAQGAWTTVVLWGLWWPAWIIAGAVLYSDTFRPPAIATKA